MAEMTMEAGSSDERVQRAVAGDRVVLQELLLTHHDRLAAAIARQMPGDLRGGIAAEDVCQEAYVAAFGQIRDFRPGRKDGFYIWLHTIAMRKLTDAIRVRRAEKRGGGRAQVDTPDGLTSDDVAALIELVATHSRTPSRSAANHEAIAAVQNALAGLKDDYRQVIQMRYIEGLPVADVAGRMKRTEGAVMMLCQRALEQMRISLGSSGAQKY